MDTALNLRILKSSFIICFILGFFSCGSDPQENSISKRPNIIWLVAEDISPALGCYGDTLALTPNIDRLATEGVRFDKAYATAPICAPSRSCLASGLYATSMGTQHLRSETPFSSRLKTLPEYMSEAGYFTSNRNKSDYNFDHEGRWEHWSGSLAPWRKRQDDKPFYSFINVGPSHEGSVNNQERYEESIEEIPTEQRIKPEQINLPPYYPDTKDTREVWAHYYNVLQLLDANVGRVIDSLESDGLLEETIIFFFGDHGFGMPRYKRWLYHTGIHVPLIIRVPEKYQDMIPYQAGTSTDQLVSFVDFPATALNMAGAQIPETMEGQAFMGPELPAKRKYIFAARDRADDMFEMSRAAFDGRYLYIRHYMPHLPYIQSGFINSDKKHAYRALRNARKAGLNNTEQEKLWQAKPFEELYDLVQDPKEINNRASDESLAAKKLELKQELHQWMIEHKDLGLLTEAEYMMRSEGTSPYDYARQNDNYKVKEILAAAELVGVADEKELIEKVKSSDSGERYWAIMGIINLDKPGKQSLSTLNSLLEDPSPSVQIQAAEALLRNEPSEKALNVLQKWVKDERPWLALQAARAIQLIGDRAQSLIPTMYTVLESNLGEPSARLKYKDFNYAAFTSWALEWALQELGEDIEVN